MKSRCYIGKQNRLDRSAVQALNRYWKNRPHADVEEIELDYGLEHTTLNVHYRDYARLIVLGELHIGYAVHQAGHVAQFVRAGLTDRSRD